MNEPPTDGVHPVNLKHNDSKNIPQTATDAPPPIVLAMIGHCRQRDRVRPDAPVYVTGRFTMTLAEARKIDPAGCPGCASVSTFEVERDYGFAAGWLIGHQDGCTWLADLLDKNADIVRRYAA
jgi:hypothetical protein